jgi:hypothetical protein
MARRTSISVWKHDVTTRRLLLGYCVIPQKSICGAMLGNCNQVWFSIQILSRIPTLWSILIFRKISNFPSSKVSIKWQYFRKTNIKHCKITCRFELDIGPGTTETRRWNDNLCVLLPQFSGGIPISSVAQFCVEVVNCISCTYFANRKISNVHRCS